LFLSALNFDVLSVPKEPIAPGLRRLDEFAAENVSAAAIVAPKARV
jgi:hypothetical protein